jgi:S1-C subfamily serine protease
MATKICSVCGGACQGEGGNYVCHYCGSTFTDADFGGEVKTASAAPAAAAPAAKAYSSEDIYADNRDGVVEIITENGMASGFVISKVGLVLTNAHAVTEAGKIDQKIFVKMGGRLIRAQVVAIGNTDVHNGKSADLALLAMETVPNNIINLSLGNSEKVKIGQHVYYIGNSKGEGLCMTGGIVSDNCRKVGERYYIMTDAATNPGNSGGPLFNENGEVIGVHVSARNEAVGMKYAIPIDTARAFLNFVEGKLEFPKDSLADQLSEQEYQTESLAAVTTVCTVVNLVCDTLTKIGNFWERLIDKIRNSRK